MKNLKKKQKKTVPYQDVDYTIYKPSAKCVSFLTSEDRIIHWIEIFYYRYFVEINNQDGERQLFKSTWEEHLAQNDSSKCEKITLTLSLEGKRTDENLITIIIYCSTGRIQIEGRSMRAWGYNAFLTIKKLVDLDIDEISPNTASKNLQTFIENITQTPTKETRPDEVNEMSPQATPNPAVNSNPACEESVINKTIVAILKQISFHSNKIF
jgi:hypothetical protein